MAAPDNYPARELSPKVLLYILLVIGLGGIIYAITQQNLAIAIGIICLPMTLYIIVYGLQKPSLVYLFYVSYTFFFTAIMRYLRQDKLSVGLDILLAYLCLSLLYTRHHKNDHQIDLKNGFNMLTVSYVAWILFTLFQLTNPGIHSEGITQGIRNWILGTFVLYIATSVISVTPQLLRQGLAVIGVFTIIAFLKLLYQRYVGFDEAELYWLYVQGGSVTHIIHSGIRYFSYFTDAANFGTCMGAIATVYTIAGCNTQNRQTTIFYLFIAAIGYVSMLMSGTRGSLAVPAIGFMLYCLLCKNIRAFLISSGIGISLLVFLAFTEIGNDNSFIRRARTIFHPTEDASFNVRVENRKEIALYLRNHPWGVGISEDIPKLWEKEGLYEEGTLPPDSFYVSIWIQTGIWGLILYVAIQIIVLLRCCYIVLFQVHDKRLRQILAALTCGVFGILVSGYSGNSPGMPPTNFLIVAMIAFVMNGVYIDKQITQQKINSKNKQSIDYE